ncbi:PQ loop repeat-domain-containing protein [Lipomyces tetrasporus]
MTDNDYNNKVATALGTIGTILWCVQLLPQIYTNYRRKSTEGLPQLMLLLWAFAGVLFGMYFLIQRPNVPLMIQPEVFTFLSLVTWAQCLYYGSRFSFIKTLVIVSLTGAFSAGLQVAVIISLQNSALCDSNKTSICWPLLLIGIIAALLIVIGLVPPYFELWRRQGQVVGINFFFLAIDSAGAILSFASLLFPQTDEDGNPEQNDYLGMVLYLLVPFMEAGIVASHFVWWLRIGRYLERTDTDVEKSRSLSEGAVKQVERQ